MTRSGQLLLVVFLLFLLAVSPTQAQKITGDITGTVSDSTGAVVATAEVSAENISTGLKRTTSTGGTGNYRIAELPVGVYKVTVTLTGFKTVQRDVQVAVGSVTTADFTLQVGDRAETIVVEAVTPVIEFTGNLNNYVDEKRIVDIPLNGRDFNSLLAITPGVQRAPGGGFLAVNISGARRTANNYLLDGMYNNDRYYGDSSLNQTGVVGIPATLVPMDAIGEFTVQQTPSAEFGVKGGAPINVVLKSGGNDWHGSAHYFRHTDIFDARNFFADDKTAIRNQQYGGTLGGPIVKDKTFIFGYWEAQRFSSLANFEAPQVTAGMVAEARARIACTSPNSIPGCVPQMTSPAGEALFSFYPVNPDTGLFPVDTSESVPGFARGDSFAVKVDQRFGDKHLLTGRYVFGDSTQNSLSYAGEWVPAPGNAGNVGPDGFNSFAPSRAQQLGISYTWNIEPNLIAETRFGYQRFSQILGPNNKVDPQSLGIDTGPLDPLDFGVPAVYYFGPSYMGYIGGIAGYPIVTRPNASTDLSEHVTWIKGNHNIKMGGNWQHAYTRSIRNRARSVLSFYGYAYFYNFNNITIDPVTMQPVPALEIHPDCQYDAAGVALNMPCRNGDIDAVIQLLLGRVDSAGRAFGSTERHLFQDSLGLYVQDDWKITPHFTLTFGLRYDVSGALGEDKNLGSNFNPQLGLVDLGSGVKALYRMDKNNLGPRLGFAWDVFGNGKTALRGGYAITYDIPNFGSIHAPRTSFNPLGARNGAYTQVNQGIFAVFAGGFGILTSDCQTTDPTCSNGGYGYPEDPNPALTCGSDFLCLNQPYGANPTGTPPFDAFGVARNLQTPRYQYYNLTLQHELARNNVLTVSYVGSRGNKMLMYRDLNAHPLGGGPRPFDSQFTDTFGAPVFENVIQLTNFGKSWYDSLQLSYTQRNWHGINAQYNYTWSHCIDLNSNNRGTRTGLSQLQNPFNPNNNRGNCDHDVTHNFNVGGTYDFPKMNALGRMGEGWQIGAVVTLISGRPFTPNLGSNDPSGQEIGTIHADCLGKVKYNTRDPDNYIANPSVFAVPAAGMVGTCGRNILRGPGLAQWDMSVNKDTRLSEALHLEFRWEVFNVFNRANFGTVTSNIRSSSFGQIFTTPDIDVVNPVIAQGGPRNMQFALKLRF